LCSKPLKRLSMSMNRLSALHSASTFWACVIMVVRAIAPPAMLAAAGHDTVSLGSSERCSMEKLEKRRLAILRGIIHFVGEIDPWHQYQE